MQAVHTNYNCSLTVQWTAVACQYTSGSQMWLTQFEQGAKVLLIHGSMVLSSTAASKWTNCIKLQYTEFPGSAVNTVKQKYKFLALLMEVMEFERRFMHITYGWVGGITGQGLCVRRQVGKTANIVATFPSLDQKSTEWVDCSSKFNCCMHVCVCVCV